MDSAFSPTWYDDAAFTRKTAQTFGSETQADTTGELTLQNLPGRAYTVCGAVDGRWLLVRVSSPSPVPDPISRRGAFDATWQNSTAEIITCTTRQR